MRKIRLKILSIVLSLVLACGCVSVSASEASAGVVDADASFDLACKSAILMEAATGRVLYEQNADESLPPASVTKIMTLLIVMEAIDSGALRLSDKISVSANAASMGGSQVFLEEGETMCAEDMLKSVIISSANDAAVALAEHVAGSEEAFVQRMNARAAELGMKNTCFENTNGLDDTVTKHLTSARDIAIMSRELIKHEKILEYSSIWMDTIRNGAFGLTNTNRLVRFYHGATGLKTGSTAKARFCVSATAKRGNMHLICVVMGAETRDERNAIAAKLLDYGFANYSLFSAQGRKLDEIKVTGGKEDSCAVSVGDFYALVSKGEESKISAVTEISESIKAPVKIGDTVGRVVYKIGETVVGEEKITATENIDKIGFFDLWGRILLKFLIK